MSFFPIGLRRLSKGIWLESGGFDCGAAFPLARRQQARPVLGALFFLSGLFACFLPAVGVFITLSRQLFSEIAGLGSVLSISIAAAMVFVWEAAAVYGAYFGLIVMSARREFEINADGVRCRTQTLFTSDT